MTADADLFTVAKKNITLPPGPLRPLRVPDAIRDHIAISPGSSKSARVPRSSDGGGRSSRQLSPGVYSCSQQGNDMFINFISPHYPNHDIMAGTCNFRMLISREGICQVRVDFVDTELLSPTNGNCQEQYMRMQGSMWDTGFRKLCGINPDQHFYIFLDQDMAFQHIDFTVTTIRGG